MTTKGLRFIQMRENAVRESTQKGLVYVVHLAGTKNPSDMFTKEDKDDNHYLDCRDSLMSKPIFLSDNTRMVQTAPISLQPLCPTPTDLTPTPTELRSEGGVDGQTVYA